MLKTIMALVIYIKPFKRRYACLCGHKTNNPANFMQHLQQCPADTVGHFDIETGKVAF